MCESCCWDEAFPSQQGLQQAAAQPDRSHHPSPQGGTYVPQIQNLVSVDVPPCTSFPSNSSVPFQSGSYPGPLHREWSQAACRPRSGQQLPEYEARESGLPRPTHKHPAPWSSYHSVRYRGSSPWCEDFHEPGHLSHRAWQHEPKQW